MSAAPASAESLQHDLKYVRKVTMSSFIGNTLEYYDFLVYGTASALVFPKLFFPGGNDFVATLSSFATFAIGFFFRPLGGMFFGNLGDKIGRKRVLVATLLTMGFGTALIGCLPTYDQIGVVAPLLLVILRAVQGFAVGGEWGGSMIIVLESVRQDRRAWYTAWPNTGGFSAQILGTGIFALLGFLGEDDLHAWGWRIPFLLSIIIVGVGLWMRRSLVETPVYEDMLAKAAAAKESQKKSRANLTLSERFPIFRVFKEDWRSLLLILGLRFAEAVPYFLLMTFALSYGPKFVHAEGGSGRLDRQILLTTILVISFIAFPAHGFFAWLSDKFGRRPIYLWGAVVGIVMAFPFMMLLNTGNPLLIGLGYFLAINLGHNAINAVQPAFFTELFSADRRYSGAAAGREIASIIAGGLTPFIATALAGSHGTRWQWVAAYVAGVCVLTVISVLVAPETFKRDLRAKDGVITDAH